MKRQWIVLVSVLCSLTFASPQLKSISITLKDTPVPISHFSATYDSSRPNDGVKVDLEFKNTNTKSISAIAFGFVFYGPFDNQLDSRSGLDMRIRNDLEAGGTSYEDFDFRFPGDFSTTTAIAFPNQIRYQDGTLWHADLSEVAAQIKKLVRGGFDPAKINQP